jgi:hypothetical protein
MGSKIADARHNPRTPQQVFEDVKAKKNEIKKQKVIKEEEPPKYKPGFDHGLQED